MRANWDTEITIGSRRIGLAHPTYFVADIAANHDGDLARAKDLIHRAAEAGANAAKFQHFKAKTIVSDYGFKNLGGQQSHQAKWNKSVFEVYRDAALDVDWTPALAETCEKAGITFFTSPYSCELADEVDHLVPAFKIGSGDITWLEICRHIAAKGKPTMLATGASTMDDVKRAVAAIVEINPRFVLMQCNTNYTAELENFKYIHLNVLKAYARTYPDMILGLSDHTPGHAAVLGAIALGARVIEKHFTDDTQRSGPDHAFSMDPRGWREMVERGRELERALGGEEKRIEHNERETCVLQRRAVRARVAIAAGTRVTAEHFIMLRPCPTDGLPPYRAGEVEGKTLKRALQEGEHLRWEDLELVVLAIVIPALNEEATIGNVVRGAGRHGQVIVVNDGSRDETAKRAREAGAEVIEHASPCGYDLSLGDGFAEAAARGMKYIVTIDADGQHPVDEIPRFAQALAEGADVVAGVRPACQRVTEKLFAWATTIRYGLHDPLCGMKGYRTEVYRRRGHFDAYRSIGTELILFAAKNKMRIEEIAIPIAKRRDAPRFGTLRGEWKILRALVLSYFRV